MLNKQKLTKIQGRIHTVHCVKRGRDKPSSESAVC